VLALGAAPALAQQSVKIGFVSTFSGPQAAIGEDMRRSVELAKEHLGGKMARQDDRDRLRGRPVQARRRQGALREAGPAGQGQLRRRLHLVERAARLAQDRDRRGRHHPDLVQCRPSQIAGELCNKNFFSTSWQNDQTPMAMGEYLNTRASRASTSWPQLRRRQGHGRGRQAHLQGQSSGEDYTKWPDQLDFSAELAKIAAPSRTASSSSIPARTACSSSSSGCRPASTRPCRSTRCSRSTRSPCRSRASWRSARWARRNGSTTCPNEQNKRYVADFKKKHNVYPSYYGAQSYDSIMLIASAAEALKGDLSNKDKVRAEMKKANFKSLRGDFKYNTNQFPIQNFYIQETVKDPQGMMTVKTIATAVTAARIPTTRSAR
jgi:branched-chain amino acid transport system substrate-binding protein